MILIFIKTYFIYLSPWGGMGHNPEDYIDFKGNIYLLVDRNVYSSAEKFASLLRTQGLPH